MSAEKMREEFESAFVAHKVEECGEGYRSTAEYMLKDRNILAEEAWWAWQTSRATLVVELPEPSPHIRYMDHRRAVETIMAQVRDALERQGVKVKP